MSEGIQPEGKQGKDFKKISPMARLGRLMAIAGLATSSVAAEGCAKTPELKDKAIGAMEKIVDDPEADKAEAAKLMERVNEMQNGPTDNIPVAEWGVESDDPNAVRSTSELREKAGWSSEDQEAFDTAVGIMNEDAYTENGSLMPRVYEVPINNGDSEQSN